LCRCVAWTVLFLPEFDTQFNELAETVQDGLLAALAYVRELGPRAGRPTVDTLKRSKFANMKEIRLRSGSAAWRLAFAFDPKRRAVVLCGASKSGTSQTRFYRSLIERALARFASYLVRIREN